MTFNRAKSKDEAASDDAAKPEVVAEEAPEVVDSVAKVVPPPPVTVPVTRDGRYYRHTVGGGDTPKLFKVVGGVEYGWDDAGRRWWPIPTMPHPQGSEVGRSDAMTMSRGVDVA